MPRPTLPFDRGIGWFRKLTKFPATWVEHFGTGAGIWNVILGTAAAAGAS